MCSSPGLGVKDVAAINCSVWRGVHCNQSVKAYPSDSTLPTM
jgi:hypothetical protein